MTPESITRSTMSEEWDLFSGVSAKFKGEAVEWDLDVSQMVGMDGI